MPADFDFFPFYDPLVKNGTDKMADLWVSMLSNFIQNLTEFLSQNGIFLPQLTTAQRNLIQSPVNGQVIYNTTLNTAQYWKNGSWSSF